MADFAHTLIEWQARHGRHDLPWQGGSDPYRVWLSEIMLQQTQVDTVIPYYQRFLARFPDISSLASADLTEVLALWSGLGYYARARNLHACARRLTAEFAGGFPADPAAIARLPGIGRSTAAAIAVFGFGGRAAILDGNVKRVLCRHFGIEGFPGRAAVEARLWALAESLLPARQVDRYIQAQMDLGATVCTRRPDCAHCPLAASCVALREGRTGELPAPRPKREKRERTSHFLVLRSGANVLLQRRPPLGLWGGLLALPEIEGGCPDARAWSRRELGAEVSPVQALPSLRHAFTHFTLVMQPLLVEILAPAARLREPGWEWLALDQLANAPLPTPVRRILAALPPGLSSAAEAGAGANRSG